MIDPSRYIELTRAIREVFGIGLLDARRALKIAEEFASDDVLVGAGYVYASGLAINVKRDRHAWNLNKGYEMADRVRSDPQYAGIVAIVDAGLPATRTPQ